MSRTAEYYREKARRFRELARDTDERTAATLIDLAEEFDGEALRLDPNTKPPNLV